MKFRPRMPTLPSPLLTLVDYYVLRRYLLHFTAWGAVFAMVMLAVQIKQDIGDLTTEGASLLLAAKYLAFYLPYLWLKVLPLVAMLAIVGALSELARHRELVALLAGGISLQRTALAPVLLSLALYLPLFGFGEWVALPAYSSAQMVMDTEVKGDSGEPATRDRVRLQGLDDRLYLARHYLIHAKALYDLTIVQVDPSHHASSEIIQAGEATWENERWVLRNGTSTVRSATGAVLVTRFGYLERPDLPERPEDFERFTQRLSDMTFTELRQYIRLLRRVGEDPSRLFPELGLKAVFPLSLFVCTLCGAALVIRRPMGSLLVTLVAGVGIVVVYYLGVIYCHKLTDAGMASPWIAAVGPTVLLSAGGAWLYATARGGE